MELGLLILGIVVLAFVILLFVLHFVGGSAFVRRLLPTSKRETLVPPGEVTRSSDMTPLPTQPVQATQLMQDTREVEQPTKITSLPVVQQTTKLGDLMPKVLIDQLVNEGLMNDKTPQELSDRLSQESVSPEDGQPINDSSVDLLTDRVWLLTGDYPGNNTNERELRLTSPLRQTLRLCKEGGFLRQLGSSGRWSRVREADIGDKKVGYTSSGFLVVDGQYRKKVTWSCRGLSYTLHLSSL